jgi:hypothetical protein
VESAALSTAKRGVRHTKPKKRGEKVLIGRGGKKPVPPNGGTGEPQKRSYQV